MRTLSASLLLLAGAVFAQTNDLPTPASDEFFRLARELEKVDRETAKGRYKALRDKMHEAEMAMRREYRALIEKIYDVRHAVLAQRARPSVPAGRKLGFTVESYPLVNGSTSTHPLGVLIACRLLGVDYHWSNRYPRPRSRSGERAGFGSFETEEMIVQYRLLARGDVRERERLAAIVNQILVVHNGTHAGYVHLTEKKADLCLLARKPSSAEVQAAAEMGVAFDIRPVALDAFVFIVNRANPVIGLTSEQLRAVYTEKTRKWRTLGGHDHLINAYQRNETSGSQQLMLSVFMRGETMAKGRRGLIRASMIGPYYALTKDQYGLAYSVYFYEHFMAACPYTRPLVVDGVAPTSETIRARSYPYVTEVYAVMRKDEPEGTNARRLRDWLLTEEGQAVVAESGYVPLPRE